MPTQDRTKVCAHLRSKQSYSPSDPAHRAASVTSQTEVIWCNHTMSGTGPDETLCAAETCCEGRWCFRSILDV